MTISKTSALKMTTKVTVIHTVYYTDLDDFVSFHYGVAFSSDHDTNVGDAPKLVFDVEGSFPDSEAAKTFDRLRVDGCFPGNSLKDILWDLCNRNLIPEGRYEIGFW